VDVDCYMKFHDVHLEDIDVHLRVNLKGSYGQGGLMEKRSDSQREAQSMRLILSVLQLVVIV
jgi:hypothetical protein